MFLWSHHTNRPLLTFGDYVLDENHAVMIREVLEVLSTGKISEQFPSIPGFMNINVAVENYAQFYNEKNYKPFKEVQDAQVRTVELQPGYYVPGQSNDWSKAREALQDACMSAVSDITMSVNIGEFELTSEQEKYFNAIRFLNEIGRESRIDPYYDGVLALLANRGTWKMVLEDIKTFERDPKNYRDNHSVILEAEEELSDRVKEVREEHERQAEVIAKRMAKMAAELESDQTLVFGEKGGFGSEPSKETVFSEPVLKVMEQLNSSHLKGEEYQKSLTAFWNEIGDLPKDTQDQILTYIQEKYHFTPEPLHKPKHTI